MKSLEDHGTACASPSAPKPTETQKSAVPRFVWDEGYALGHRSMDETHHEFVACVNALLTVGDDGIAAALETFAEHASRHFGEEDDAMRASTYGSAGCHIDEHAAVLRSVDEVREALAQGRTEVVRAFAKALTDWFPEHVRVMDQGLARWLVQQELGAAPVIIRRRLDIAA